MEKFIDHKGNEFSTLKEMCDHWKIHTVTFSSRIKTGMSLKDALETKIRKNCKPCTDHLGNKFESEKEASKNYTKIQDVLEQESSLKVRQNKDTIIAEGNKEYKDIQYDKNTKIEYYEKLGYSCK